MSAEQMEITRLRAELAWVTMERLQGQCFKSRRQAADEVVAWMLWYNRTRLHSTLAYISPMQFEETWLAGQHRQASA